MMELWPVPAVHCFAQLLLCPSSCKKETHLWPPLGSPQGHRHTESHHVVS